jgi:hypothetical protein
MPGPGLSEFRWTERSRSLSLLCLACDASPSFHYGVLRTVRNNVRTELYAFSDCSRSELLCDHIGPLVHVPIGCV